MTKQEKFILGALMFSQQLMQVLGTPVLSNSTSASSSQSAAPEPSPMPVRQEGLVIAFCLFVGLPSFIYFLTGGCSSTPYRPTRNYLTINNDVNESTALRVCEKPAAQFN